MIRIFVHGGLGLAEIIGTVSDFGDSLNNTIVALAARRSNGCGAGGGGGLHFFLFD